jgi:Holliday junction resolvase RusA-like endonuclease
MSIDAGTLFEQPTVELAFFCMGSPAPGGSKNFFPIYKGGNLLLKNGRPIIRVTDAGGQANVQWKKDVALQARAFMQGKKPLPGPLKVEFVFHIRRPAAHYRTGRYQDFLRDDAPVHHTQKPDAIKYARSTEDSLTGIVWVDDAQNVRICSEKRWAAPHEKQGCAIRIVVL